jgi:hypothetical protein
MNLEEVEQNLSDRGLILNRLYNYLSPDFSILHAEACSEFLNHPIRLHEYYCDVKRLEKLDVGEVTAVLYNPSSGFSTEVKVRLDADSLAEVIQAIEYGLVEKVLIFELTHHNQTRNLLPVPAGKVYQVIKEIK